MHLDRSMGDSGCHDFTGRKNSSGYGQLSNNGVRILVHRWIWETVNRSVIPDGLNVLHHCDNPACCNPAHLYVGTHTENMRDKVARGRSKNMPRGAAHKRSMAKITEDDAIIIKRELARGERGCDIAYQLKVSRNLVSEINLGKTWAHL